MREWKCKQVVDFEKSTTTVKEERSKNSTTPNEAKYQVSLSVTEISPLGIIFSFQR